MFQSIDDICSRHKMQGEYTPASVYMCDMLMIRFYSQPVINILRGQIGRLKNREDKHYTFDYWIPVLSNMLKNNKSASKPNAIVPDWDVRHGDDVIQSFAYIIGSYVLTDYSYEDMVIIQRIVNTYQYSDITYACAVGRGNNVYEPRYINAVLSKELAKKQVQVQKIHELTTKIEASDKLLNKSIHNHSILDIASMQYRWDKKLQDSELERKAKEVFGI